MPSLLHVRLPLYLLLVTAVLPAPPAGTSCTLATRHSLELDFATAAPLWKEIVSSDTLTTSCPHSLVFYGVYLLTSPGGGDVRGGDYLDRAISLDPTDYIAHSFLGAIHEKLAREAHLTGRNATFPLLSAISHFKAALAYRSLPRTRDSYPQGVLARPLTYLYRSLGSCYLWSGQREAAAALHKEAVAGGEVGWTNEWARPTLPLPLRPPFPLPFIPRGAHPAIDALLGTLEGHLAQIRKEYQGYHSISGSGSGGGGWQRESGGLETSGGWQVLTLAVDGRLNATLCPPFPVLCSLLQASPLALSTRSGQTKFSVLQPGASILPHAGPTVARLRVHCTLQGFAPGPAVAVLRVGEASQGWKEGECFVFDESFEHEVVGVGGGGEGEEGGLSFDVGVEGGGGGGGMAMHSKGGEGKHPRVVLLIDIPNPFLASLVDFKKHAVSDVGWKTHGRELKELWKALSN